MFLDLERNIAHIMEFGQVPFVVDLLHCLVELRSGSFFMLVYCGIPELILSLVILGLVLRVGLIHKLLLCLVLGFDVMGRN